MATEKFTRKQFEDALTATKLRWVDHGNFKGEPEYVIPVNREVYIIIRSSMNQWGVAEDTGKNSIRCWLVGKTGKPLGSKVSRWVTRLPGWQDRMNYTIQKLYKMGQSINFCRECGQLEGVFIVKKEGVNKDRVFKKCPTQSCKSFVWLTEVGEKW